MKNKIGKRLVRSFLIIILITISIIDIFLLFAFSSYYYNNISKELIQRMEVSLEIYRRDYSDKSIEDLIYEDSDIFLSNTNAEVQILDKDKNLLSDSIGRLASNPIETSDVLAAERGEIKTWKGEESQTGEAIMSVAGPIKNNEGETIGYLRFISSMEEVKAAIFKTIISLLIFTLFVALLTTTVSLLISKSIVRPILELTEVAKTMLKGNYEEKAKVFEDDEIGELAKTLNAMSDEIINKDRIKNDFISSISHELRTPLTSIKGWAVVLKDAKEDEKDLMEDGLNIIENEADRLAKMVEELLDFSRYISGRITLDKEIIDISQTCLDISKQMRPRAKSNNIELITDLPKESILINADENRIKQLLINLLDNAIKFTSDKGWVKFQMLKEDDKVQIIISDNGMGMTKEELAHVKEKFYKGKHSKSHSGIGLSISDEITKLHQGSLEIFSEENIGTTVKVSLPIEVDKEVGENND
ncbi:MAG: HAMP domain-containing sensor histidine kinase [Peptoniphilus harei]|uniref:histidine kinase n=1 Tax=Peptoniphilus harei ACS-146-V-Sch2b TaxID=908338 RepID=E4KXE5_9FIRM|nr:HAMP domain-containing sensor histidine kinase [Peptoniphilus harei]EFR33478.1 ATPase/histidine kinase/DNA gyrase B/HSP90 domain protein [Peptoniphilus harei ACS-146-V-Sch2b]MDK7755479.1 HAMP domain-containing sensor histidine kinase [Peptoniphilus harei]MDK7761170.1 HAMP domain-containing sensor histidine kinase [Peptoniphilus harei]MDK8270960.1 HAMP domain-containing sensor histidine kinase [Peptoniphilus harei]MDK8339538.1 HAMP domain-containing sensor histidine kinase [Peptoniphilus har